MANWKNSNDYPPEDCDAAIFGWEFARRNADIRLGALHFVNAPDLDPSLPYWNRDNHRISFDGRLMMFSNALMPAHALCGASLGVVGGNRMHVEIDLTEPLSETMRKIEILAKFERGRLPTTVAVHEHSKLSPAKLVQYLRILDAKESGASSREIEDALGIGATAVDEGFAKAKALRDGQWRDIARIKPTVIRGESKLNSTGNKSRKDQ